MILDTAMAGRVSQADKKGWVDFTKDIEKSIKSLTLDAQRVQRPKGKKMTNQDLAAFFGQVGTLPTAHALRAKARAEALKKPPA